MRLPRLLLPELLDYLSPDHPAAIRIRRDLKFVNSLLPNARVMAHCLASHFATAPPRLLLDIGAGGGTFMLRVARRLAPRWQNVTVLLLDRQALVDGETRAHFAELKWQVEVVNGDILDFFRQGRGSGTW